MVSQRRLFNLLTMLILLSLFAVACERPLGGTDDGTTDDQTGQTEDANAGGGTDGSVDTTTDGAVDTTTTDGAAETTTDEAATETTGDAATDETAADTSGETTTEESGDTTADVGDESEEAGGGVGEATTETTDDTAADESTAEETTTEDTAADETSTDTTTTTIPATHTVAAGENLYRIGLKYGISWVAIANTNNLANPNILTVGQVLNLPGGSTPNPGPTPSPQTETTYKVQPGDNLFRIGLKFGISWVQIAEANGLVNPNVITVGDDLKIPVDAPGPAPAFSHVVKPGETLFLISLQYGVSWPSIAEANNLTSPYVIYVGQTLEIPGK